MQDTFTGMQRVNFVVKINQQQKINKQTQNSVNETTMESDLSHFQLPMRVNWKIDFSIFGPVYVSVRVGEIYTCI